jgi:hypothetical protein
MASSVKATKESLERALWLCDKLGACKSYAPFVALQLDAVRLEEAKWWAAQVQGDNSLMIDWAHDRIVELEAK